jgi:DNA-binding transcriptional LysR family regulator
MDPDYALFAKVVAAGSLSAAGREMHLSPAMVSKRLARLEQRLGARLIHRTTRRLATTEVGQTFYEDVVAILAAAKAAEAKVAGLADMPSGRLHVSAPTSFGRLHIAPYLKDFLDAYPGVELELDLSDGFVDLIENRVDLAIRISATTDGSLVAQRLAANRRVICAAPAYLEKHGTPTTLEMLAGHRLLAATNQTPWRLESNKGARTIAVESAVRTNSSEVVRELAIAGFGIALRSTWDVGAELRAGALVQILPTWEGASDVAVFAVHPRNSLVPAHVKAFVSYLTSLYNPVPPWESAGQGR